MKNNTLYIFAIILYIGLNSLVVAQNRARYPFFADYHQQQSQYNPAFAGSLSQPAAAYSLRLENRLGQQHPLSMQGLVQGVLPYMGMGWGITAAYHRFDDSFTYGSQQLATRKQLLKLAAISSFPLRLGDFTGLRLGVGLGALRFVSDEAYPTGIGGGTTQPSMLYNEQAWKLNMDLGVSLQTDRLLVGVAMQHLNEPKYQFSSNSAQQRFVRQANITAAYTVPLTTWVQLVPTAMVSLLAATNAAQGIPPYANLGTRLEHPQQHYYLLVHYKVGDDRNFGSNSNLVMPANLYRWVVGAGVRWSNLQLAGSYYLPTQAQLSRIELSLSLFRQADNSHADAEPADY